MVQKRQPTIRLFIAQDDKSAVLLKTLEALLERMPPSKRPKVKIHVAKIEDPSKFPEFLTYLEEIYGGIYTLPYRRYKVEKLPALVVDDRKVFEGYFPSEEELISMLEAEGIELPLPPTPTPPPSAQPPVMPPPPAPPLPPPSQPPALPQQRPTVPTPSAPVVEQKRVEPTVERVEAVPERPASPPEDLKGTCHDCIFYDKSRKWCLLLRAKVEDPLRPICGRGKR